MAVTNHRIVTGTAGGATNALGDSFSNVGSGADVTWPTSGNPSYANTGFSYLTSGAAGTVASWTNLTTASDRGTHYAWDAQGDGDSKPAWATGPGYVEVAPSSATPNSRVEFISQSVAQSISATASNLTDGFTVTFGFQWVINGTYLADATPAHNTGSGGGAVGIIEADHDATAQSFRLQYTTRNVGGLAPGIIPNLLTSYPGTDTQASIVGGANSAYPMSALGFNKWYQVTIRVKAASTAGAEDGKVFVFVNGQLVMTTTGADSFFTTTARIGKLCALFYPYTTAESTVKFRYCGPVVIRTVPDADVAATIKPLWHDNVTDDRDIVRHYPAAFANPSTDTTLTGAPWNASGTVGTLPTIGTAYGSGGTFMGRRRFVVAGTAAQTFTLDLNWNIWDGDAEDSIIGPNGWTHLSFNDIYAVADGTVQWIIKHSDGSTLHDFEIDEVANTFSIDGVVVQSGLASAHRWQVVVSMKAGQSVFILHDLTLDTKSAAMVRSYSTTNTWTADGLGQPHCNVTYGASESIEIGGLSVFRRNRIIEADSFTSSAAHTTTPEYHCAAQRCGQYWNQAADFTVGNGYDPCPLAGGFDGVDICMCLARSGGKLSESETHFWSALANCPDLHGILQCGVVNDATASAASDAEALAIAESIAARAVRFARLCVRTSGTAIIIGAPDIIAGSLSGSYTAYAMTIPDLYNSIAGEYIAEARFDDGKVWWLPVADCIPPSVVVVSSDGIHPSGSTVYGDRWIVLYAHILKSILPSLPGYNLDGSVTKSTPGSSGGMIFGMIGN